MHGRKVRGMALQAINPHLPVLALVASRIALGFPDVCVFAEEMPPFAEAHAYIQDRARFQLLQEVDNRWDDVGTARGHRRKKERVDE